MKVIMAITPCYVIPLRNKVALEGDIGF